MKRNLVTIRKIKDLLPIKGADRIELAVVDGWKAIVKKGLFSVGDYGVYFEIDSLIPLDDERFSFIGNTKKMDGVKYKYIRTITLRGELSQGLLHPIHEIKEIHDIVSKGNPEDFSDVDFSDNISILKYEEPEDLSMGGQKSGDVPFYIQKTGEKRIQNVYDEYSEEYEDVEFYPTLKMDGSSMTVCYVRNPLYFVGKEGIDFEEDTKEQTWISSHRLVFRDQDKVPDQEKVKKNTFFEAYKESGLKESLPLWCEKHNEDIAIQGELLGPGIQKNFEKFKKPTFRAFYVYFVDKGRRATPDEFKAICEELNIETVVTYPPIKVFKEHGSLEAILALAEGESEHHASREGLVFKSNTLRNGRPISFKAISNSYLLGKK